MAKAFNFTRQTEEADCGAACLKMVADYYGKNISLGKIKQESPLERSGMTLKGLSIVAENFGFRTNGVKVVYEGDEYESGLLDVQLPCIAFWKLRHYVVIYRVSKRHVWIADPAFGKKKYERREFEREWLVENEKGVLLLLEPQPEFYATEFNENKTRSFFHFFKYLLNYRLLVFLLIFSLFITSLVTLILPFLTQMMVDKGIVNRDMEMVYLMLTAQLVLFASGTTIGIIQGWIFLHIGSRINVSLVNDFFIKLVKLPISFFNSRVIGDLLQRIDDHNRINSFITGSSITVIFSLINVFVFSIVLLLYSAKLFAIFWVGSILYLIWIFAFFKKRAELDNRNFEIAATNQSKVIEIISGIQEIKLQNSERKRRWQWVNIQGRLFKLNIASLIVNQIQGTGANIINQLKNIFISFFAASAVMQGEISLGMMLAVQFIIGSINAPLESLITFFQQGQAAKISFRRLNEIHQYDDEEVDAHDKLQTMPSKGNIEIKNLSFRYAVDQPYVLSNVNLSIPENKITAIVGTSGSGKTTLVKMLLNFYKPTVGDITVGDYSLGNIRNDVWRSECGAVLQDSFIFPDTIAHNIAESSDYVDKAKLAKAAKTANADEFISKLHAHYNTAIGAHGINLSRGQMQRLLIARAVYKEPSYLFFDEATNALDSSNEKIILSNLDEFYSGRTVVIVAHRLSTVKNADQIVVLENGKVVEIGSHEELLQANQYYARLVSNQIEVQAYA